MYLVMSNGYKKKSTLTEYVGDLERKTKVTLAYNTAWINVFVKNGNDYKYLARLEEGSIWLKKVHKIEYEPLKHSILIRIYGEV